MIVTVAVPSVAVGVAEKETMKVHVGVHWLMFKFAVTPEGSPDAEKVIGEAVPVVSVAENEDDGLVPPCATVRLDGVPGERPKSKFELMAEITETVSTRSLTTNTSFLPES